MLYAGTEEGKHQWQTWYPTSDLGPRLIAKPLAVEALRARSKDCMLFEVYQLNAYGITRGMSWSGQDIKSTDLTVSQVLVVLCVFILVLCPVTPVRLLRVRMGDVRRSAEGFSRLIWSVSRFPALQHKDEHMGWSDCWMMADAIMVVLHPPIFIGLVVLRGLPDVSRCLVHCCSVPISL